MADKKPVYTKCPRCELNYIQKKDKYCDVCKQEMKAGSLEEEVLDNFDLELCPICKINYIADGESMCQSCMDESLLEDKEESTNWKNYLDTSDDSDEDEDILPIDEDEELDSELDSTLRKDLDEDEDFKDDFEDEDDLSEAELQAMKDSLDDDLDIGDIDDIDDEEDEEDYADEEDEEDEEWQKIKVLQFLQYFFIFNHFGYWRQNIFYNIINYEIIIFRSIIMRYNNLQKTLFGYKLVYIDSYGRVTDQLKLPKTSPLKLRPCADGGICFLDKNGGLVQSFLAVSTNGDVYTVETKYNTKARVNVVTGAKTPEYVYELDQHIITEDGAVLKVDADATCHRTPYLAPLTVNGEFRENRICGDTYVFKGPTGRYVLLNSRLEKVVNMEFETSKIKNVFNDGPLSAYTAGHKHYFCDRSGNVIKSIDANLKIYRFNSHNPTDNLRRFAAYDKSTNSTIVYAYDEEANKIKVETTLSNKVTERYLDNRRVLYVTVNPNGKYGLVNRVDKNLIPHVYDSVSKEHLKIRHLSAFRVVSDSIFKVSIKNNEGETKYGAYDLEGHNILPSKYSNIDLSESAKMADGTYRFMVSNVGRYYGVVNSNGETLVPLKYIHFPSNKETVTQRAGKGTSIERLVLNRPNGEKVYFNVFAENILATEEEQKSIVRIYQGSSKNPVMATTKHSSTDRSLVYGRQSSDSEMLDD